MNDCFSQLIFPSNPFHAASLLSQSGVIILPVGAIGRPKAPCTADLFPLPGWESTTLTQSRTYLPTIQKTNAYGIVFGRASNLILVDIDNKTPEMLGTAFMNRVLDTGLVAEKDLATFQVSTPSNSGAGRHLYFSFVETNLTEKKKVFDNFEIFLQGTQALGPWSILSNGTYRVLPNTDGLAFPLLPFPTQIIEACERVSQTTQKHAKHFAATSIATPNAYTLEDALEILRKTQMSHQAAKKALQFQFPETDVDSIHFDWEPKPILAPQRLTQLNKRSGLLPHGGFSNAAIQAAIEIENQVNTFPPYSPAELQNKCLDLIQKYAPVEKKKTYEASNMGSAAFFADNYSDIVKFNVDNQRWYFFHGHSWKQENWRVVRLAVDLLPTQPLKPSESREAWIKKAGGYRFVNDTVDSAAYVDKIVTYEKDWNTNANLFCFQNGVYDSETRQFRDGKPTDLINRSFDSNYNPTADDSLLKKTILEIFDYDEELASYWQRVCGYAMQSKTIEQCAFWLSGSGSNGKSLLLEVIASVFGDYALAVDEDNFASGNSNSVKNYLAQVEGKRFVFGSELGKIELNEGLLKKITHGEKLTARYLYREATTFTNTAKFFLAFNEPPIVRDTSKGFWRSIQHIPFDVCFEGERCDKNLKEKLLANPEGIVKYLLDGLEQWKKFGLNPPEKVLANTNETRIDANPVAKFLAETTVVGTQDDKISFTDMYQQYRDFEYAKNTNEKYILSERSFHKTAKTILKSVRKTAGNYYTHVFFANNHKAIADYQLPELEYFTEDK